MPTSEQMQRAEKRAKERAVDKADRAAKSGIRLPPKRTKRGWEILREKLKTGTLMNQLQAVSDPSIGRQKSRVSLSDLNMVTKPPSYKSWKMTAQSILLQAKQAHEQSKIKRMERVERRKLIQRQRKLERELEYLNFPTIIGWYFDGFFSPYFQLNFEHATIFNEMEVELSKNKEKGIKETFAEQAKRYFWPPDVLGGLFFRTRGIYLDFKEIVKDPPHTPPEIILDQRMEAVTLFVATEKTDIESRVPSDEFMDGATGPPMSVSDFAAEEERIQRLIKEIEDNPNLSDQEKAARKKALLLALKRKKEKSALHERVAEEMRFRAINKYSYYFDDQIPGFFKKRAKDRDKYYYDGTWDVWRIKRKIVYYPNDFYWDEQLALFFPKDRTRPPDYYIFDHNIAAYRVAGDSTPPNWRGVKPSNFFFDHRNGKWIKQSKAHAGIVPFFDQNGQRMSFNKDKDIPDDYYFDHATQQFERKVPDGGKQYFYDPDYAAWRHINTPLPPKGSPKPIDFYWNEEACTFVKKDAPASFFVWDPNNNFFRKKKSLHGKYHPKNYTWVEKEKRFKLKMTASRYNLLGNSHSLYWRPDRDYDKPWLEYVGGYRDFGYQFDYERLSDEEDGKTAVAQKSGKTDVQVTSSSTDVSKGGKKLQFSTSEPTLKGRADTPAGAAHTAAFKDSFKNLSGTKEETKLGGGILKDSADAASAVSDTDALMFVDTIDRKTLKVTGIGHIVDDVDLRKYFASVKKVVRPKKPGTNLDEDYAYLKFKTNEGASAALKTMHEQKIKGQTLHLAYKLKDEDETVGGQRDAAPASQEPPKKPRKTEML